MTLKQFFDFFDKHYHEPIEGTHCVVKFYAQLNTFSYELHDERKPCFLPESRLYESDVHYAWLDKDVRKEIVEEVVRMAKKNSE